MTDYEQIQQMLNSRCGATVDLDHVLITEQLFLRPTRTPDYKAESEALSALAQELVSDPGNVLHKLCELALALCGAHSAGVSIKEEVEGIPIFRWRALDGEMASYLLGMTPRDFAPCGVTVDRNAPQLFSRLELYYPYVRAIEPPVFELLLIPFCLEEKPVGTLWVVSSKAERQFDREDARLLLSLSRFASAAYLNLRAQEGTQAANSEIARQARLFDTVLSSIADSAFIFDVEGRLIYANRALLHRWQKEFDEVAGKTLFELAYSQELATRLQEQMRMVVATKQPLRDETSYTGVTGVPGYYEYIFTPVLGADGQVEAVAGTTRDITIRQREKAEKEHLIKTLEIERARLTSLFMQAPAFMAVVRGEQHIFEQVNPPYYQLVGQRDVLGKSVREAFPEVEGQGFFEILDEVYRTGTTFVGKGMRLHLQREADSPLQEHYIDFVYQPLIEADGSVSGIFAHGIDLTERKLLEEQLAQAQKMEGIGRLAGGIAHDFNNLLTVILGYTELALEGICEEEPMAGYLANILSAAERAASLTQQLLTVARRQIIALEVVDLNELVADADKLLRRVIGEDIEIVTLTDPSLGKVKTDPGRFANVLLNLAMNARDAMPQGGKLFLETANVTLSQEYTRTHTALAPGEYVLLTVSDTGVGMAESVRQHIFEPFFTTKEFGKGIGLGLATAYGIVKQSEGHIQVESEPGQGATFKIYLPRVCETLEPDVTAPSEANMEYRGTETVLLVEDEPLVLRFAAAALRARGYHVLEAALGEEALRIGAEYPEPIDLVVSDVVMPLMNGPAVVKQLLEIRPRIKALYASGYAENNIAHHGVLDSEVAFLQKPYSPTALARKVREALDSAL